MLLVRKINQINLWSRIEKNARALSEKVAERFDISVAVKTNVKDAVRNADIICTVTASADPVVFGDWIKEGTHINAVGACTPVTRELDTVAMKRSKLFTDCYESLFNEAGDFLIPKKDGDLTEKDVHGEIGEVLEGMKRGRQDYKEITIFKSLGIAAEDIFSAWHIYKKLRAVSLEL
jgi:ornithine cyclodeaminase